MRKLFEKIRLGLCKRAEHDVKARNCILWYWWRLFSISNDFADAIKLCYINNIAYSVVDVEKMELLSDRILSQRPNTLYKFFSNASTTDESGMEINYSIEALINDTVFIKNPRNYNDPYDTYLSVDYNVFMTKRIQYYLAIKNIEFSENDEFVLLLNVFARVVVKHIADNYNNINALTSLFATDDDSTRETLRRHSLIIVIIEHIKDNSSDESTLEELFKIVFDSVYLALEKEYAEQIHFNFKTACFTSRFDSILMWSHYADEHKGFCVEYDVSRREETEELRLRLLPVIYCDYISDLTSEMCDTNSSIFSIYSKGILRKSTDWRYENEWRLVFDFLSEEPDKPIKFLPIRRILIGCKMYTHEKQKIIQICKDKNIDYIGMRLNGTKYKMEYCERKCENCQSHIKKLEASSI